MNEHRKAFFAMLKTILWRIDPIVLHERQIDKMAGVREFNFNGYCTKWVYSFVNCKTYMTQAIPTEPVIINLLDDSPEDNALWARVIGKIARYPMTGVI